MTPLGVLIGMVSSDASSGSGALLLRAILVSMSSGTFIFIGLVEMLPAGLVDQRDVSLKMMWCTLGFALMALVGIWV